jgi:hypothetical protein
LGNDFLAKLEENGIPALGRLFHLLDPESGFLVRSQFRFREFIDIAQPSSPLRRLADVLLGFLGLRRYVDKDARWFLDWLFEVNSSRVQNDVLNRMEESRNRLESEIRKLLHEVSRVTGQALARARTTQAEGATAVDAALVRLDRLGTVIASIREPSESSRRT